MSSANEITAASKTPPPHDHGIERFADGEIAVNHGRVNLWLIVVYTVMFAWAIYYGVVYWGGLGPGLDY